MRQTNGASNLACMTKKAQGMLLLRLVRSITNDRALRRVTNMPLLTVAGQYQPAGDQSGSQGERTSGRGPEFNKTMLSCDVQNGNKYADDFPVNAQALSDVFSSVDESVMQSMLTTRRIR